MRILMNDATIWKDDGENSTKRRDNEEMIQKQILRAREHSRNDLREREKHQISEEKLVFNFTYYSAFQNVRNIMEELHILLISNKELS